MKTLHRSNVTLVRLVMGDNALDSKTVKQLAQVLESNARLEDVDLTRCKLGHDAHVLFASLPLARAVRRLNLSENGIKDVPGNQLADAPTLTELNLAGNILQDDAIIGIADQVCACVDLCACAYECARGGQLSYRR